MNPESSEDQLVTKRDLAEAVDKLTELVRDVETSMLTAFHGYAKGQTARVHSLESGDNDIKIRLHELEQRVLELERRSRTQ